MQIGNTDIETVLGDIADQPDIQAVVNAANAELQIGGGVAGALHRAAGPGLADECRPLAPIKPGEAVITGAHQLSNEYVIHCLGPIYGLDKPEEKLLADCYRNALKLAAENRIPSIAFPAISTGAFGYPIKEATDIAVATIQEILPSMNDLSLLRFVLYSSEDMEVYRERLDEV